MRKYIAALTIGTSVFVLGSGIVFAETASHGSVSDEVVAEQRAKLQEATAGKGFGPQAPRDLSVVDGANTIDFGSAPDFALMNLCNVRRRMIWNRRPNSGAEVLGSSGLGYAA